MSEHEQQTPAEAQPDEGAQADETGADGGTAPAADAEESPSGPHTSTVTDLPEGAEVDPLTDQAPEPVRDDEGDDE